MFKIFSYQSPMYSQSLTFKFETFYICVKLTLFNEKKKETYIIQFIYDFPHNPQPSAARELQPQMYRIFLRNL